MSSRVDQFLLDCAVAAAEVPLPSYMDWAFEALAALVRFDSAGWGIGTHAPPVTHAIHLRGVPPAVMLAYDAGVVDIDYIRAAAAADPGRTINDYDIRDSFPEAAAAIDARLSAPFGLEQMLATSVPHDATSGLQHLILLWRAGRGDPFDEAARADKQRCVPHMVAGFRVAQRLHLATAAAAETVRGHALVDGLGVLHSFDDRFVRILQRQRPAWLGGRLPADLVAALSADTSALPGIDLRVARRGELFGVEIAERRDDLLSPAQRRVAEMYVAGMTYRQIAAALGLAPSTVRNHIANVFTRMEVTNKIALAARLTTLG